MNVVLPRPEPAEPPRSLYANRVRVYPKDVQGPVRRVKWAVLALCLGVYYALPWLRWNRGPFLPDQAVLLDLWNERFYLFGLEFWPQDIWFLTGLLIMAAIGLFLVTSLFGRLWCGYACPQTVWTDLYMLVERKIEGDRNARMKRDAGPLTLDKAWRKAAKHAAWVFIAFWTGGAWIMYYVNAPVVTREFWTGTASGEVYFFTGLFTLTTYLLAGWAREQVCTYMCPWPRFQSAMMDERSLIVTYESWRGEPRGHGKRSGAAAVAALGDCVDCRACVHVCPTGIDIRDGLQLECIGCGLCIDACNDVMHRTGGKPWLITWDTAAGQAARREGRSERPHLLRLRTVVYAGALLVAGTVLATAVAMRASIGLSVQHDRAPLFVRLSDGNLRNAYTIRVSNKTPRPAHFELTVDGMPGAVLVLSEASAETRTQLDLPASPDTVATYRVLVQGAPPRARDGSQPLDFVLRNSVDGERTVYRSVFLGPGER